MFFFRAPACPSCIRRLATGVFTQVRGKKKLAKATTITVRLLRDVPKFGRKGAIIPVTRGMMRNRWFPVRMAEYMTTSSLKNIPSVEIAAERDVSFRPDKASKKPKVEIDLLSPAKSISILESFLPSNLQFYRSTISPTEDVIHGSITANDVAHAIRAIASASGDEGSRVVIQTENITFKDDVEGGKLRQLGEYVFEVRMKGTAEFVRRKVLLMRQEEAE